MFWASVSYQHARRSTECREKLTARLTTVLGSVSKTGTAFEPKVEGSCNNTHDAPRAGRAEAR